MTSWRPEPTVVPEPTIVLPVSVHYNSTSPTLQGIIEGYLYTPEPKNKPALRPGAGGRATPPEQPRRGGREALREWVRERAYIHVGDA